MIGITAQVTVASYQLMITHELLRIQWQFILQQNQRRRIDYSQND